MKRIVLLALLSGLLGACDETYDDQFNNTNGPYY
jgi:hypothetical protein